MKHIQLDCSHFPLKVVERLATSLPASLKRLQLTLGEDGDSQMSCFARLISGVSLDHLDVSSSNLREAAAHALADALSSQRLRVAECLNLKDNPLGTDGVAAIAQCIGAKCISSLKSMIFAGVTPRAIQTSHDPPATPVENSNLHSFFDAISTAALTNLTTLDISNNNLGMLHNPHFALIACSHVLSWFDTVWQVRMGLPLSATQSAMGSCTNCLL